MKTTVCLLALASVLYASAAPVTALRVNNVGYLTDDLKTAVYIGDIPTQELEFRILSPDADAVIDSVVSAPAWGELPYAARIYFSSNTTPAQYTLSVHPAGVDTPLEVVPVYIGDDAYSRLNIKELPLNYLRQQRCGFNPVHNSLCHQHDGYMVLSGDRDGEKVDVRGGWHDASDYLQYLPTSANTVMQLLYAYRANPSAWDDNYDAAGLPGTNGVADILDEARWGLEWMLRMNPEPGLYFNQIADDRDHRYVGTPQADNVDYGWGEGQGRPVYPVIGEPAGLRQYKNRSTGKASSVGKFASAFALGARIFSDIDSTFSAELEGKAAPAYEYALLNPGVAQTTSTVSPYFYEEDNWVDDMELAAAMLGRRREAVAYGRLEPVTPWMGADSANHYQWYPFINLGHAELAAGPDSTEFRALMRDGLEKCRQKGLENAFRYGVPFIWCSNNLGTSLATQGMLYRTLSGDNTYLETETAARDWLFGLNPWGQTMIILPSDCSIPSPEDPHSAMTDMTVARRPGRDWLVGGLVDGPVYSTIYGKLWGVHLRRPDKFERFHGRAVYHDDYSDYSSNEPTMDGTAALSTLLLYLCQGL